MIIRVAQNDDAASLSRLLSQLGYPAGESECLQRIRKFSEDGYKIFVAEENETMAGFIALHWYNAIHHTKPIGRVIGFCVEESLRSSGIGSALLNYSENFLHQMGCFKVEITSNLKRKDTHEYYFRKGYVQSSMHFIKILEK